MRSSPAPEVLDVSFESTAFGLSGAPDTPPRSSDPLTGDSVLPVGSLCVDRGLGADVRVRVGRGVGDGVRLAWAVGEGVGLAVGSGGGVVGRTHPRVQGVGLLVASAGGGDAGADGLAATEEGPAPAVPGVLRTSGSARTQAADRRTRNRAGDVGTARW